MFKIKPIAIYLPQFHPIPENDAAWGEGFTEWTNVRKVKPLFEGHYQPHIPHESIGYYDLRDPNVLVKQATLAKEYNIYGFAFYHYWFHGKRLLNLPIDNMLESKKPDFPFLFIWANENWTRSWDGLEEEIIQEQKYSNEDDLAHIQFLCKSVFSDKRYITIDEKPIFIVYRTELFPNIKETSALWREEVKKFGFRDLYLVRVENFLADVNPLEIGFDASMEFAPDLRSLTSNTIMKTPIAGLKVNDYTSTILNMLLKEKPPFPRFRCVFPGWDNTPRISERGRIFINNSPETFKHFLFSVAEFTKSNFGNNSQFFFINAWNEWGEGCHIEPDQKNGHAFLEAIQGLSNEPTYLKSLEYAKFVEINLKSILNDYLKEHRELESLRISYKRITDIWIIKISLLLVKKCRRIINNL
jgi:hypothetical protein